MLLLLGITTTHILCVAGEECDDGNLMNHDGCSSTCTIERSGYWDCENIGEPCQPMCGWTTNFLQGFVMPKPPPINIPWCTGITYLDFLQVKLSARAQWMQTNLISCTCLSNPYQTLPYDECNYTNKGCRQCNPGYYRDDLFSKCTACGSTCPVGFRPFNASQDSHNLAVRIVLF